MDLYLFEREGVCWGHEFHGRLCHTCQGKVTQALFDFEIIALRSLYNAMFGSIGMDCVITKPFIKGHFFKGIIENINNILIYFL